MPGEKETADRKGDTTIQNKEWLFKMPRASLISLGPFPLFLSLWLETRGTEASATAAENGSEKHFLWTDFLKCQYIALIKDAFPTSWDPDETSVHLEITTDANHCS